MNNLSPFFHLSCNGWDRVLLGCPASSLLWQK